MSTAEVYSFSWNISGAMYAMVPHSKHVISCAANRELPKEVKRTKGVRLVRKIMNLITYQSPRGTLDSTCLEVCFLVWGLDEWCRCHGGARGRRTHRQLHHEWWRGWLASDDHEWGPFSICVNICAFMIAVNCNCLLEVAWFERQD